MQPTDKATEMGLQQEIETLLAQERFDQAQQLVRDALANFPHSAKLYDELGWMKLKLNQYDQALHAFEQALHNDSSDEGALQGKIAALRKMERFDSATTVLEQALRLYPESKGLLSERGWLYLEQKQYPQAAEAMLVAKNEDGLRMALESLLDQHRTDEANHYIEEALIQLPHSASVQYVQGLLFLSKRCYNEAVDIFGKILTVTSADGAAAWLREAALQGKLAALRKKGLFKSAESLFDQENAARSGRLGLLSERGWLYFDQGQLEEAARYFADLCERNPKSSQLRLSYAEVLMWTDRSAEALGVLHELRALFPHDLEVREKLGLYFLRRNDLVRAETEFQGILEEEPQNALGLNGLGLVYFGQERFDKAAEYFQQVLRMKPDDPVFLTNLARTLVRIEDPDELDTAETYCKKALEVEPRYAQAYGCLGIIAFKQGNLHESEYYLRRSTDIIRREGSFTDLGALYVKLARYKEAAAALSEAIELNPFDSHAHFELGNLYLQTGATKKAIREFRQAIALEPNNDETRRALAITFLRTGEFNAAEEVLWEAIALVDQGKRWRVYLTLAQVLIRRGDELGDSQSYDQALTELNTALSLKPEDPDLFFYSGIARAKLGDYRSALRSFRSCLERKKDHYQAKRFAELIREQIGEERKRSRGSVFAGIAIAIIAVVQLVGLWFVYLTSDKIPQGIMTVTIPLLLALIAVGLLVPWLVRFKVAGLEAELRQPAEQVSSGPRGQIGLMSSPTSIAPLQS
jgi:tetratricopeptide (TPR) repeat protein